MARGRSMARRLAPLAFLLLAGLAGAPAPTLAASLPHEALVEQFNHGRLEGTSTPGGSFEDACGVALDSSGDIYVADYHHDAIDIFDSLGHYLTQIAGVDPGNGPCGLAVDSSGDIYVNNWREDVVKLTPDSYPPGQITNFASTTIDESGTATGVALGPTGHVYVDDGTYVAEYEPSGALVAKIGEGAIGEGFGLAVSEYGPTFGYLYLADASTSTVKVFDPATSSPVPEIEGKGTPQGGFAYLGDAALAIDPNDGHVFVADNIQHLVSEHPEAVLDEFNSQGDYRGQISHWTVKEGEPRVPVEYWLTDAEPTGLAISEKGEVLLTNGNGEGSVVDFFGPTAPAQTLTVATTGSGAGTVIGKPAGIVCPGACQAEYTAGETVKLTAAPDAHSEFTGFSGGGCSGTGACFVTMSAARSVSAEFAAIPQKTLEVDVGGGGQGTVTSEPTGIQCGSGTCAEHFDEGSTVILTETPAPHSRFTGWGGPECDESTATICQVQMSSDKAVGATFAPIPQQTLEVSVSGEGSILSEPAAISCPGVCAEHFDEGSTVTLTALPAPHQELRSWSGACVATAASEPCEVTMSEAEEVGASFGAIPRTLTVAIVGQGTIAADHGAISSCAATCSGTYLDGETVTLRATPAPGYGFAGFSGGGCGGTGPCTLFVSADSTLTANFAATPAPPSPGPYLRLGKPTLKRATAITATGNGLEPAHVHASAPGALTLRLALDGTGKRALARRGKLEVKVRVLFVPADAAAPLGATRTVEFKSKRRRH
jgi:DNA-binding beta-propeller fold protein YncE